MIQIPVSALFDQGKGPGVWLVKAQEDQGQGLQATWRAVQVAGLSGESAAIAGGLAAGDRIVVLGAHLLHEGEAVRLADSSAAPGAAANGGAQK
ncbi:hypothetical protein SDC9_194191 [bioreactor metagenome]|uniref:Multidrug resistance protein MdtA n=1 Tax=bioreactor metagenome TaxID=1076179 RepID=A0A645I664_9ZZZZ